MGIKEKDAPTEGFAGSVLLKGLLSAACDLGSGPGARAREVMWGMAPTCMIPSDKTCGAPLLGMRSLRAWLCPCLPWVCGRRW